eukprot:1641695-Pleurochrysis_carterae.AAC.4
MDNVSASLIPARIQANTDKRLRFGIDISAHNCTRVRSMKPLLFIEKYPLHESSAMRRYQLLVAACSDGTALLPYANEGCFEKHATHVPLGLRPAVGLSHKKRGTLKQDSVDLERMSKLLETSNQSLAHHPSEDWLQTERLMDSLELERFAKSLPAWRSYVFFRDEWRNIYEYNKLLHWLGETDCQYEWLANNESLSMNVSLTHRHEIAVTGGCRL